MLFIKSAVVLRDAMLAAVPRSTTAAVATGYRSGLNPKHDPRNPKPESSAALKARQQHKGNIGALIIRIGFLGASLLYSLLYL